MGCGGSAPVQDAYESPPTAATQKSAPSPAAPAAAAAPAADESPRGILWASGQYGKERRNSDASVKRGGIKFGEGTNGSGISIIQGVPVMKARLVEASEEMDGPGGPGVMSNGNPRLVKLTLTAIEAAPEAAEPAAAADDDAAPAPAPAPAAETAPPADEKPRPSEIKRKDLTAGLLDELMGEAVETEAARNSETG